MKLTRTMAALFSGGLKAHFGQYAEDVAVRKYFPHNTTSGRYLDLGAYHPFKHSNTAFFWLRGWDGVNVDANPKTVALFNRYRKNDTNIWAALVPESILSKGREIVKLELPGQRLGSIEVQQTGRVLASDEKGNGSNLIDVPAVSVKRILVDYEIRELDFLNVDIEGVDTQIIEEFDFDYCLPKMICIEDFSESFEELLVSNITKRLSRVGYKMIARIGYSSIFSFGGKSY